MKHVPTAAQKALYQKRLELIGAKIRKLRLEAGYSNYEKFAFENDIPRIQYWRMERGTNFTLNGLLRILAVHKLPLKKFFAGID